MLRASLLQGEKAVQAWKDWNRYGGLKRVLEKPTTHAVKRLLPLLSANQRKNQIPLAPDLQRILRTAQLREQSRNPVFRRACKVVFETLTNAKIPFLVLKGAAFAETVYDEPSLRHCHDCDIFVSRSRLNEARASLLNAGFIEPSDLTDKTGDSLFFAHSNGLPINLHSRLLRFPEYGFDESGIYQRASSRNICGTEALILSPADALLHVCVHASTVYNREFLCWACDSWKVMASYTTIDWDRVLIEASNGGVQLPAHVIFKYLADELDAPIPSKVQARLESLAMHTLLSKREAALFGLVAGRPLRLREITQNICGIREALIFTKWIFFPSPQHMLWKYCFGRIWMLPLAYLFRPLRAIVYRLGFRKNSGLGLETKESLS